MFMKLAIKSLYVVRALFDRAYHGSSEPSKIDSPVAREKAPPEFLQQIFRGLDVVSVEDLLARGQALGAPREGYDGFTCVI